MTSIPQNCKWVDGVSPVAVTAKPDGRHNRKARSAERILSACRASMRSGEFRPSVLHIARVVGCADRNVFAIFQTRENLYIDALRDEETQRAMLALILRDSLPPQTEADRTRLLRAIVLGRA